jgi:hypothetical protein
MVMHIGVVSLDEVCYLKYPDIFLETYLMMWII